MLVYTSAPYAGSDCKACALTLRIAHADGTHSTPVTSHGAGIYDNGAAWSPDGTTIAFVRGTSDTPGRLYTVHPDGSAVTPMSTTLHASAPSWSPDGATIAFASTTGDGVGILAIDVAGGPVRTEVATPSGEVTSDLHDPAWSPDGAAIAFAGRHGLYVALGRKARAAHRDGARRRASVLVARRSASRLRCALHELHDGRPGARSIETSTRSAATARRSSS